MSATSRATGPKLLLPALALVVSLIAAGYGAFLTITSNDKLNTALVSGTGTAADVYGSQSAITIGAGVLTAGLIGVVLSIVAFGLAISLAAVAAAHAADDFEDDFDDAEDDGFEETVVVAEAVTAEPPAAPAEPALVAEAEPAVATEAAPAEAPAAPAKDGDAKA
ncbi:hypothetical protein ACGGZK_04945 [Agromyces sp. MMS24-K17]|uniref:hypothetical protein n=1 Tax=Agromyces sp. MMS24-K17 TaxID=3372850 RepID=UPI003755258C